GGGRLLVGPARGAERGQRGGADLGDRGVVGGRGQLLARALLLAADRERDALRQLQAIALDAPEAGLRVEARHATRRRGRLGAQGRQAAGSRGGQRDAEDEAAGDHGTTSTSTAALTSPSAAMTVVWPGARARSRRRSAEPSRRTATVPGASSVHVTPPSPARRCAPFHSAGTSVTSSPTASANVPVTRSPSRRASVICVAGAAQT